MKTQHAERKDIAVKLLSAMLGGLCSANINALYVREFQKGVIEAPNVAWNLAGELQRIAEAAIGGEE